MYFLSIGPTTTPEPTRKLYDFDFLVSYAYVVSLEYEMRFVQPIF